MGAAATLATGRKVRVRLAIRRLEPTRPVAIRRNGAFRFVVLPEDRPIRYRRILGGYFHLRSLVRDPAAFAEIPAAWSFLRALIGVYLVVAATWYVFSVVCLVHSFVNAADWTERNQVKWILFGSLVALIPIGYT